MIRTVLLPLFALLLVLVSIFIPAPSANADLIERVKAYDNVEVSESLVKKVKRYDHLIEYFSSFSYFEENHRVNPLFIEALILAESAANPGAISHKGAYGLGQIMPATGIAAGKELAQKGIKFRYITNEKLANLTGKDLFRPSINILLTCYLISKYNHKFEGKLELVLSAWNAGEYTKSLKKMQPAEYKETENLIGKVNGYYLYLLKNQ